MLDSLWSPLDTSTSPLYAQFSAQRLKFAKVAWLNERAWFLKGVDVSCPKIKGQLCEEITRNFAFVTPRLERLPSVDAPFLSNDGETFNADRYGGSFGTIHGGSGRCGSRLGLSVKGIGATPLCSDEADWYHKHGCMWLEEAIREAVLGEIAALEFPHGAVPILAIIDTGIRVIREDGSREAPRALVIRPEALRVAHLERSIFFGSGGTETSDQYLDAQRVKRMILQNFLPASGSPQPAKAVAETFGKIADQIGFGWANRLFHGGYFSSNVCADGRLIDFGSFRAMPSWDATATVTRGSPFGQDFALVDPALDAVSFYVSKYASGQPISQNSLKSAYRIRARKFLREEISRTIDPLGDLDADVSIQLIQALTRLFDRQQENYSPFSGTEPKRSSWLSPDLSGIGTDQEIRLVLLKGLESGLVKSTEVRKVVRRLRWLSKQRHLLYRANLQRLVNRFIQRTSLDTSTISEPLALQNFISRIVTASRRRWKNTIDMSEVAGVAGDACSTLFFCERGDARSRFIIVEAYSDGRTAKICGQLFQLTGIETSGQSGDVISCKLNFDWDEYDCSCILLFGQTISIPKVHWVSELDLSWLPDYTATQSAKN